MDEFLINVKLDVVVTFEDIEDLMLLVTEGISYWADEIRPAGELQGDDVCDHIANGGELRIHIAEGPITEGGPRWYTLNQKKLVRGIKQYLNTTDNPTDVLYFNEARTVLDLGYCDTEIADLIVQYALFGERVFA